VLAFGKNVVGTLYKGLDTGRDTNSRSFSVLRKKYHPVVLFILTVVACNGNTLVDTQQCAYVNHVENPFLLIEGIILEGRRVNRERLRQSGECILPVRLLFDVVDCAKTR